MGRRVGVGVGITLIILNDYEKAKKRLILLDYEVKNGKE